MEITKILSFTFFALMLGADCAAQTQTKEAAFIDLSVPELKKHMLSPKPEDRDMAMLEMVQFDVGMPVDRASDAELVALLLKGLSDPVPLVRLDAAVATASRADRLVGCKGVSSLEKALVRLSLTVSEDKEIVDGEGNKTKVAFDALSALRALKYNELPPPRYSAWEEAYLAPRVDFLADSKNEVDLYGASWLCADVSYQTHEDLVIKILRRSLTAKSEEVRLSALMTISDFDSDHPQGSFHALGNFSLLPEIRKIAREDASAKCKVVAANLLLSLEPEAKYYEKELSTETAPPAQGADLPR